MKNRLYLLLVIVLSCLGGWTVHAQLQRSNPARQTWEYKSIVVGRNGINENFSAWAEDGKQLPPPVDIDVKNRELGNQGWELVTVFPVADTVGGATTRVQSFYKRPK
jgi:hypothetical protein